MLGKRLDYQVEENKIHFFFEKEEAFLEVITESIMNVFVPYETKGHRSKAIEGEIFPTLGNPTIPNFISLNISFKCIDFTVFSDVFTVLSLF